MNHRWIEARLEPFAEGKLPWPARLLIRRHLTGCRGCHQRVEEHREYLDRMGALRLAPTPDRDLWPGIARGIARGRPVAEPNRRATWRWGSVALAATAALALLLIGPGRLSSPGEPLPGELLLPGEFVRLDREATSAARDLLEHMSLEGSDPSGRLAPGFRSGVGTIDRAITEAQDALAADPGNSRLVHELRGSYLKKLALIRRFGQLVSRITYPTGPSLGRAFEGRKSCPPRA